MKIRLHHQQLRARLGRDAVRALTTGEPVEARTRFGPGAQHVFTLALCPTADLDTITARATEDGALHLLIPTAWLDGWAEDDREGFSARCSIGSGNDGDVLEVLVQKDYRCTTPRDCADEDTGERFERPHEQ